MMEINNYINQLSIDCVIFGYKDKQLKILVAKIKFKGDFYCLPSGFIFQNEDIDMAAQRVLLERTGLENIYLEQFKIFGKADRLGKEFLDKLIDLNYENNILEMKKNIVYEWFTKRFVSIGYYALVNIENVIPKISETYELLEWYNIHEVPEMIMDNEIIFEEALIALKDDIKQKFNIFNLLPEKFTIKEVQDIYETIFEEEYVRTNFQKKILEMNVLERLEKKFTGAKNKAPYLYRLR